MEEQQEKTWTKTIEGEIEITWKHVLLASVGLALLSAGLSVGNYILLTWLFG